MKTYMEIVKSDDKYCTGVVLVADNNGKLYNVENFEDGPESAVPVTKEVFYEMVHDCPSMWVNDNGVWLVSGYQNRGDYVAVMTYDVTYYTAEYEGSQST